MAGSSFGNIFRVTTYGESHGKAMGVIVDGCPAGLELNEEDIQKFLDRRKPGQSKISTPRKEDDKVEILSGIFEGVTTGTPISLIVYNKTQKSSDYSSISDVFRPGHADFTFQMKYGVRDYRGGGRSSARETIGRVAAGAIAMKILEQLGVEFVSYVSSVGPYSIDISKFSKEEIYNNPLYMPDKECAKASMEYLEEMMLKKDSVGSTVECIVSGVPIGLGEPVFDKLDARLGQAIMSIGAVKGFEIGIGINASTQLGSNNNDSFIIKDGKPAKSSNSAGGILGGISDGSPICIKASFKPTPSIFTEQKTINSELEEVDINIKGRHDPIIGPRAAVVVEAMAALTIIDLLLMNMTSKLENIIKTYK